MRTSLPKGFSRAILDNALEFQASELFFVVSHRKIVKEGGYAHARVQENGLSVRKMASYPQSVFAVDQAQAAVGFGAVKTLVSHILPARF